MTGLVRYVGERFIRDVHHGLDLASMERVDEGGTNCSSTEIGVNRDKQVAICIPTHLELNVETGVSIGIEDSVGILVIDTGAVAFFVVVTNDLSQGCAVFPVVNGAAHTGNNAIECPAVDESVEGLQLAGASLTDGGPLDDRWLMTTTEELVPFGRRGKVMSHVCRVP